jgi:hypothetical protein
VVVEEVVVVAPSPRAVEKVVVVAPSPRAVEEVVVVAPSPQAGAVAPEGPVVLCSSSLTAPVGLVFAAHCVLLTMFSSLILTLPAENTHITPSTTHSH